MLIAAEKLFEGYPEVRQAQFIQEEVGKILIKIIPGDLYKKKDEIRILTSIQKMMGENGVDAEIEYVTKISRTKAGKHKYLIQKLPIDFGDSFNGS